MQPLEVIQDRIAKGVKWLDMEHGAWWKQIDLDSLDMRDCNDCVLGQVLGNYSNYTHNNEEPSAYKRGFDVFGEDYPCEDGTTMGDEYAELGKMWTNIIENRQIFGG